jgi:glycerol dehydrogenase-like iron-containing ADH family enzyme
MLSENICGTMSLSYHYMQLPREVIVGKGTLNRIPEVVKRLSLKGQALVISDEQCFELAGKTVGNLLIESGLDVDFLSVQTITVNDLPNLERKIRDVKPRILFGVT